MTAFDSSGRLYPWPWSQLSILANALGTDAFIEQMGFQSKSGTGYVTAVDLVELTDPNQGAVENSFLLIQDIANGEYAALNGQFNDLAVAVGTRYIATAMQSSLVSIPIPPDQLIYNLLNDTAVYEECKRTLGLGRTVFLYFSLLCYRRYEEDLEQYEGVNLAIHDKGDNIGTPYEVAVFDRTFVDARSEDARIEFISKFIRPLIEDWFAAINWDEGSGGTASAVATANASSGQTSLDIAAKYPKVSLLQYKAFLENESNWSGIISEKIHELFVDSMMPWGYAGVSGTQAGGAGRSFILSDLTFRYKDTLSNLSILAVKVILKLLIFNF